MTYDPDPCATCPVYGIDCAAIPFLDAIYLLKGWEKSKGARRELAVALQHNLQVIVEGSEP